MDVTHNKVESDTMDYKEQIRKNLKFCVPVELPEGSSETAFKRIMQRIAKLHT